MFPRFADDRKQSASCDQMFLSLTRWSVKRKLQRDGVPTIFAEDGRSVEVVQDGAILLKRTLHLFPRHELPDLTSQLHKFLGGRKRSSSHRTKTCTIQDYQQSVRLGRPANLKVDVAVGQPVCTSFVQEVNVFDQQTEEGNHNLKGQKTNVKQIWIADESRETFETLCLTFSLLLLAVRERCAAPLRAVL